MASPQPENPKEDLLKKIRSHEVAISELNNLPPSRESGQPGERVCDYKSVSPRRNLLDADGFRRGHLQEMCKAACTQKS
ncbi:hypothetical protein ACMD2_05149 [Ananas comosus]|uniref:Uncharacterized protein n=1 Tax=Ananas comosus TaxID=4615 RepID=A0A199W1Y2_ANACO|nr:hypothetical protein ACMD2_05149 [Ananas comosus]